MTYELVCPLDIGVHRHRFSAQRSFERETCCVNRNNLQLADLLFTRGRVGEGGGVVTVDPRLIISLVSSADART